MTRMLNAVTKTEMLVADERVEEYKALGHTVMEGSLIAELAKEAVKDIPTAEKSEIEKTNEKLKKAVAKTSKRKRV